MAWLLGLFGIVFLTLAAHSTTATSWLVWFAAGLMFVGVGIALAIEQSGK